MLAPPGRKTPLERPVRRRQSGPLKGKDILLLGLEENCNPLRDALKKAAAGVEQSHFGQHAWTFDVNTCLLADIDKKSKKPDAVIFHLRDISAVGTPAHPERSDFGLEPLLALLPQLKQRGIKGVVADPIRTVDAATVARIEAAGGTCINKRQGMSLAPDRIVMDLSGILGPVMAKT